MKLPAVNLPDVDPTVQSAIKEITIYGFQALTNFNNEMFIAIPAGWTFIETKAGNFLIKVKGEYTTPKDSKGGSV